MQRSPRRIRRNVTVAVAAASLAVTGTVAHIGAPDAVDALRPAGSTYALQVIGRAGVTDAATAAAINFTVTNAVEPGHLTIYPCGTERPLASTLNYVPGSTIANSTIVPIGADGKICIYNFGITDVIADITGWFTDANITSTVPTRLVDTRDSGDAPRPAGSTYALQVIGRAGVTDEATAASINFTVTNATEPGHLTVYPCGTERPLASTLNYAPGSTIANSAIVPIGADGRVCIYNFGATDVIADITGWFTDANITTTVPTRLVDTRNATSVPRPAGSTYALQVTGRAGVTSAATAAAINFTATNATEPGHLTIYPCGTERPVASTVNYAPGVTVANSAIVPIGADGRVCIYNFGATDIVADITGWFTDGDITTTTPTRLVDTRNEPSGVIGGGGTGGGGSGGGGTGGGGTGGGGGGGGGTGGGGATDFATDFTSEAELDRFRRGVYHRDDILVRDTEWPGDHDASCGPSNTSRTIRRDDPSSSFYICDGHLHTSVADTSGYSIAWFTPDRTFDRSDHDTVAWSVTATDLGTRQWWEVSIVPAGAPFLTSEEGVASTARIAPYDASAVVVGSGPLGNEGNITTNGIDRDPLGAEYGTICGPAGIDPDACASKDLLRDFELKDNRDGTLTVSYFGRTFTYPGVFPDRFEVYFADHNFEPMKDNSPVGFTWHWDDISVS